MRKHSTAASRKWAKDAVFTVGPSTLPIEDFIALLHAYGIKCVAGISTTGMPRTLSASATSER
jgi:hypothetical protein